MHYSGKNVLIYGIAKSGIAAANLLFSAGAKVSITDDNSSGSIKDYLHTLSDEITFIPAGEKGSEILLKKDLLVVSPGIPIEHEIIKIANEKKIDVIGEIELASSLTETPIFAVTGTNGKTTTTTLIYNILKNEGKSVFLGGNIGTPLSYGVNRENVHDYLAVEISSFQLEHIKKFRPFVSVILNISPDHLDRHRDMDEYIKLKKRILINQEKSDYCVLNRDDPEVNEFGKTAKAKKVYFSRFEKVNNGAYVAGEDIIISKQGVETKLCTIDDFFLQGTHMLENFLAASAASSIVIKDERVICNTLFKFRGLEHRVEFVRKINGVTFLNDSKATNVGALYKSLEGLKYPVILIAGGIDKGNDYDLIKNQIDNKVSLLIALGESKNLLIKNMGSKENMTVSSIDEAVNASFEHAKEGATVLLSPACASFDMFKDYKDRGLQFKKAVWSLCPKN